MKPAAIPQTLAEYVARFLAPGDKPPAKKLRLAVALAAKRRKPSDG